MMHGHEKSDPAIVATKPANKAEHRAAEQSAVEMTAAQDCPLRCEENSTCQGQQRHHACPEWRL